MTNTTVEELNMKYVVINMKDPSDHVTIDALVADLTAAVGDNGSVESAYGSGGDTSKIKKILNKVFYGLVSVTMFLCFFSLCASMSANLYE